MMKPSWRLFALFCLAITIMLGLMALFNLMLGGKSTMLYASKGFGMWGVMILPVVALLLMPVMMFFFFRLMSGSGGLMPAMMGRRYEPQSQTESLNLAALTLSVPTVNCAHCKLTIEQALGSLPGVASTHVDVDAKQVVIRLIPPPTRSEIEALLAEIGHPPESQQAGAASVACEV